MNCLSFVILAILAVFSLAAPQRVIEKTTIIKSGGGPGFGRAPGFGGPQFGGPIRGGPQFGGPGFNRGPAFGGPGPRGPTIVKTTVIRG